MLARDLDGGLPPTSVRQSGTALIALVLQLLDNAQEDLPRARILHAVASTGWYRRIGENSFVCDDTPNVLASKMTYEVLHAKGVPSEV